jgi:UDP-N-acetylmuramyl-tripeptide synthetase
VAKEQTVTLASLVADAGFEMSGGSAVAVAGVTSDSRKVKPGFIFVAIVGVEIDGHQFIAKAVAAGACLVVMQDGSDVDAGDCLVLVVGDTNHALGMLAASFYGFPARDLTLVGITGTNGKTTCAYLIESVLQAAGLQTGLIGTVSCRFCGVERTSTHTTPDAVQLQALFAEMRGAGVSHVVMEVSSHALTQQRVAGLLFDVALFTNLSRDHLDYHHSMDEYFEAKQTLFTDYLAEDGTGIVVDDGGQKYSSRLVEVLTQKGVTYLVCGKHRDVSYGNVRFSLEGTCVDIDLVGQPTLVTSPLVGDFNLQNILGTMGVGKALGIETKAIIQGLKGGKGAPGRMEQVVISESSHPALFVDYAHTPDALEKVLATLSGLSKKRVIVVFGCGGDRDTGKRPLMGWAAEKGADISIATSDNPRSEDPMAILEAIETGMQDAGGSKLEKSSDLTGHEKGYFIIESRREAIACAIGFADKDDVVLISGKGHEDYQDTRSGRAYFDDRREARHQLERVWGQTAV